MSAPSASLPVPSFSSTRLMSPPPCGPTTTRQMQGEFFLGSSRNSPAPVRGQDLAPQNLQKRTRASISRKRWSGDCSPRALQNFRFPLPRRHQQSCWKVEGTRVATRAAGEPSDASGGFRSSRANAALNLGIFSSKFVCAASSRSEIYKLENLDEEFSILKRRELLNIGTENFASKGAGFQNVDSGNVDPENPRAAAQEVLQVGATWGPEELPPVDLEEGGTGVGGVLGDAESSPLQTAGSLVLTGLLTLILARTFRRRLAKAKEERLRSNVVERLSASQQELEKAKADLAAASNAELAAPPQNPLNAIAGAVVAGGLAYVAYLFTAGVDERFATQSISTNYTVRQITITIRTIISGLGWLATGVFGANSLGLFLYAIQLALGLDGEGEKAPSKLSESTKDIEKESLKTEGKTSEE